MRISVIGGSTVSEEGYDRARAVGRLLGDCGHEVVCGGRSGVMAAVCQGARDVGGHTIGILPGEDRAAANPHVETAIATGMGNARNALVVLNGDATIAIEGNTGTLSELALALDYGRPVAALDAPRIEGVDGIDYVDSPTEAVDTVVAAVDGD
ncbi:TIGR00725 family protein [Halovenus salina]|uniref:TIGR00725 family protein n=1 Tax=Halovenus salina TaxID=1510225 RepID=UPI002260B1EB|nr:TIGR00725 family protein [Halovenus salina]